MHALPTVLRRLRPARISALSLLFFAALVTLTPSGANGDEPVKRPGLLTKIASRLGQTGAESEPIPRNEQPVCQETGAAPSAQRSIFGESSAVENDAADDPTAESGPGGGEMGVGGIGISRGLPRAVGVTAGPNGPRQAPRIRSGKESVVYGAQPRPTEADLRIFAKELDAIEQEINEWGHGSMSGLVMFPMSNRFHINNTQDINTYIRETKAHSAGAVSLSREVGMVAAAAAGVGTKELGLADSDVPATVEAPSNLTVNIESHDISPSASAGGDPKPVTQEVTASGHAGFQTTATLSPEQVDTIAASAFVNKEVMNLFSFPVGASDQYVMFFGLAQVNVSPGWRTHKDYYCEVQMRPVYAGFDGTNYVRSYEVGQYEQPMVFSAFPLLKAQVLDLQHHEERQADMILSFAGAAAAAGNTQSAKALLNYHKKLTQDVKTRNALPLLVPSSDGTQLTYRFDPGLQAVEDPASIRSKPANVLNATSIPTLFVMVCEREELARWSHVNILVNTRFAPLERRHLAAQVVYDLPRFSYIKGIRRSNLQRLKTAQSYTNLADYINMLYSNSFEQTPLVDELQNRFLNLRTLAGGVNTFLELPQPESYIAITSVYPDTLSAGRVVGTQLSIEGDFGRPDGEAPTVLVAGRQIGVHTYAKNGIILNPLMEDLSAGSHAVVVSNRAGLHIFPGGLKVSE